MQVSGNSEFSDFYNFDVRSFQGEIFPKVNQGFQEQFDLVSTLHEEPPVFLPPHTSVTVD